MRTYTPPSTRKIPPRQLLGARQTLDDVLVNQANVSPRLLIEARILARRRGVSLGAVLIANEIVRPLDYYRALAQSRDLPFSDLDAELPPRHLIKPENIDDYIANGLLPIGESPEGVEFVSASEHRRRVAPRARFARDFPRIATPIAMTTPRDIRQTLLRRFPRALSERAISSLGDTTPEFSARRPLTRAQSVILAGFALLIAAGGYFEPYKTMVLANIVLSVCFLSVIALRGLAILHALRGGPGKTGEPPRQRIGDDALPVYTILVPLFREARMLPHLAKALLDLDYPREKLDIKFIMEAEDTTTIAAAKALNLPGYFEFLTVPASRPQTKPKALNFALPFVRGDYLVIYDAEDRPDPDQLRAALDTFHNSDEDVACLQARLAYYNANENWLTRQFAIEYATLFDLLMPALEAFRLPLPLGGTSNHFKTAILKAIGGWDPHNVTEDADLGIRLARRGYRARVLDSDTHEEASCSIGGWIRQRSRWLKGWIQTYFVHMRNPAALWRELGPLGFVAFQVLTAAVVIAALVHPWFFVFVPLGLFSGYTLGTLTSWPIMLLGGIDGVVLLAGYGISIAAGALALKRRPYARIKNQIWFIPLYWLLISIGAYLALWQFITRPFYWEKTDHGLSRVFRQHKRARRPARWRRRAAASPGNTS